MKSYYALRGSIRYYIHLLARVEARGDDVVMAEDAPGDIEPVDFTSWKEPPHIALANMRPDVDALVQFTRRYGIVSARIGGPLWLVKLSDVKRFQEYLQDAWRGSRNALDQMLVDLRAQVRIHSSGLEIVVVDLWTLIRLLFLHDRIAGHACECANPDCPARFFLMSRRGQKFCSHKCAVLINVQRFRKRQAEYRKRRKSQRRKHGERTKR